MRGRTTRNGGSDALSRRISEPSDPRGERGPPHPCPSPTGEGKVRMTYAALKLAEIPALILSEVEGRRGDR